MPHGRKLRTGRFSERNRAYLCTTVVRGRRCTFADWRVGRFVVDELRWQDTRHATRTIAFVVMPDHLHWLFELCGEQSLSAVVASVKKRSAMAVNAATGLQGSLWQAGFHDHAVRREEDLKALAYH